MRFFIIILFSISLYAEESKVICELDGTYSITYKDINKTYLSEGIEFFKNLATQTQQTLFLLQRAKTSFASEDWEKDKMYVVQYWEADTQNEKFKSLVHTFDPSPIWLNPNANWTSKVTKNGIEVTHSMKAGEEHPATADDQDQDALLLLPDRHQGGRDVHRHLPAERRADPQGLRLHQP